ncbi:hypothetical protein [Paraburkholderia caffeinilytica]|uniref:Uncharacterized protein n=1 Tax=Paraburkholderia caffeinilytica TaxID=1761016 RepID=A0ABQ1N7J1_9BURK|nr:hypothetical protein [Paraburkholderia caffeinilytica]GGC57753.1 hypothetical protein GCM10011400_51770 [Paraburkholderia caffeinilytica]CAB3804867.1 hypothetical protein LMG28690_06118 [Paraburkholderia caffeinilytica]
MTLENSVVFSIVKRTPRGALDIAGNQCLYFKDTGSAEYLKLVNSEKELPRLFLKAADVQSVERVTTTNADADDGSAMYYLFPASWLKDPQALYDKFKIDKTSGALRPNNWTSIDGTHTLELPSPSGGISDASSNG